MIEDCAQAHLARYKGELVGTFGNAATFSFYPGKNLGAYGDAGCIVTNDDQLADWMATFARHGGKGEHVMEGINSRMDGLQAAILLVKLPHLRLDRSSPAAWPRAIRSCSPPLGMSKPKSRAGTRSCLSPLRHSHREAGRTEKASRRCRHRDSPQLSEGAAVLSRLRLSPSRAQGFSSRLSRISRGFCLCRFILKFRMR